MCGFSDGEFFTFRPARELDGNLFLMVLKNGVNIFFFLSFCLLFFVVFFERCCSEDPFRKEEETRRTY